MIICKTLKRVSFVSGYDNGGPLHGDVRRVELRWRWKVGLRSDKHQMAGGDSDEGISLKEVQGSVLREFSVGEGVRPRGYDKEFESTSNGDYCGSNAVNVVYNEDEIVEDLRKKRGPYRYNCTTNDALTM
ncbi:hypothetical protein Bca52824_004055 [Brassica carinata]|uniref:Uncharacterized protein n=1 Tax=Brassica carinata TaxID=52824 RepID=A0A8X8BFB9_BRACI|nr:hypothetical protein Bca52824_004055 [Brassica carinata]